MRSIPWILSLAATATIALSIPYLVMGQSDGSQVWVDGPDNYCSLAFACTKAYCADKVNGTKCTNGNDCSSYGICINGKPMITQCPTYQSYDCTRGNCFSTEKVNCTAKNYPRPYYTNNPNCSKVSGTDGFYPTGVDYDTTKYLVVRNTTCMEATCPSNQIFNVWTAKCTDSPSADFYNMGTCYPGSM